MQIWEDEAMDNEVGSFWELEIGCSEQFPAAKFSLILRFEISILSASILRWTKNHLFHSGFWKW